MTGSKFTIIAEASCFDAIEGVVLVVEWHCQPGMGVNRLDLEHQDD